MKRIFPRNMEHRPVQRKWPSILALAVVISVAPAALAAHRPRPPRNVSVTDRRPFAYANPSIAVAPGRPIAISYVENTQSLHCYLALSRDNGARWRNIDLIGPGGRFPIAHGQKQCVEPRVAYSRNGTLYYVYYNDHFQTPFGSSYLYSATVYVTVSRDGGRTFTRPRRVDTTQPPQTAKGPVADDEPRIATDPITGRVYIAWTRYAYDFSTPSEVLLSSAPDGSTRFSRPRVMSARGSSTNVPMIAASGGRVYYTFQNDSALLGAHAQPNTPLPLEVRVSRDGSRRFGRIHTVALLAPQCTANSCPEISSAPSQSIVAAGKHAYLVWSAARGTNLRLRFSRSLDGGAKWTRPQIIGIPPGLRAHHQVRPFLALAPDGRLDLVYFDQTFNQKYENTYLTASTNGGRSFSTPRQISSRVSNTDIHPGGTGGSFGGNESFAGTLVASLNGATFMAWTDSRRGTVANAKQDVFFANVLH